MHGDISQFQREATLKKFRESRLNVLVATDVASRGLDIPNVDLVIQIEPPKDTESYIHRSGRTARAGKDGSCITFFERTNSYLIDMIQSQAGIKIDEIPAPKRG
jgi:ATP-dependent RNA helicase DDX21